MSDFLPLIHEGKVRKSYTLPDHSDLMLIFATNNLSTHNVVHESSIPKKGEVLTAMSLFFAENVLSSAGVENHIVASGKDIYKYFDISHDVGLVDDFSKRALVVKKLNMIPYEFIRRGYMAGSLWDKFHSKGLNNPYGIEVSKDIKLMSRLKPDLFTPTDKSETDDPVPSWFISQEFPAATLLSKKVYKLGREFTNRCGIEIIDFKCEVGIDTKGNYVLADEWLNGDCCRFVWKKDIKEGVMPPWLDKEVARKYAESIWNGGRKTPILFPEEKERQLTDTYINLFETLTGQTLEEFWKNR